MPGTSHRRSIALKRRAFVRAASSPIRVPRPCHTGHAWQRSGILAGRRRRSLAWHAVGSGAKVADLAARLGWSVPRNTSPHWELPKTAEPLLTQKDATRKILDGWLPAPKDALTRADMVRLLDASWLADERLFCAIVPLREDAVKRWRLDATRIAVALVQYRLDQGRLPGPAILIPQYFPQGLPVDPITGQAYRCRLSRPAEADNGSLRAVSIKPTSSCRCRCGPSEINVNNKAQTKQTRHLELGRGINDADRMSRLVARRSAGNFLMERKKCDRPRFAFRQKTKSRFCHNIP